MQKNSTWYGVLTIYVTEIREFLHDQEYNRTAHTIPRTDVTSSEVLFGRQLTELSNIGGNTVRTIIPRGIRWEKQVVRGGGAEGRNTCRILIGNPVERRPPGRLCRTGALPRR
jgi:hypothetical protein